ncbi:16S rRNA (cytidine(1402)-2'-O)-methyltransferase [Pelagovum pacificum]|uniref:Ribosomal RNA small subunit methyltransferase I n=1 Tax=Pelagovum pacificum TaxID=2588711 RepID=A0A5C5G9I8_9RHOB|nr:16S rRNA (cytidine(1402)-2'-O)-methyltransferase [Pelagovum pacificum]QQA42334.1 16S rRNA (cytidine(1402)-2'-O)-methyltransferase [Pelagovum pacificum]TNY31418.1 16S rRNA (cytidine(1402)-2'-O)-methyltransferase [Pelagovum pacificum]
MNFEARPLDPGLYLVSTPIGNARDITLRALDVLAAATTIAAEDTRTARRLLEIHGVPLNGRHVVAYHDHSGPADRSRLVDAALAGSVAYVSEAGTPLLADPGFRLARDVRAEGGVVTAVPGASALLSALAVGGMPTDRFLFAGFLPPAQSARRTAIAELGSVPATLVFYESPKRIEALVADLAEVLGPARPAAVCRELTKKFEEVIEAPLGEMSVRLESAVLKGEIVMLVGPPVAGEADEVDVEGALRKAMETMRIKDAATAVAGALGLPRRDVYQKALEMKRD